MNDTVGEVKLPGRRTSRHSKISIKFYTWVLDLKILSDELDVLMVMWYKFHDFLGNIDMLTFS